MDGDKLAAPALARAVPSSVDDALAEFDFFDAVLPRGELLCLWQKATKRHVWTDSISGLLKLLDARKAQPDWYYAVAGFGAQQRTQAAVKSKKALHLDLDVGEGKPYATQDEALAALDVFCAVVGLTPTYVVSSGRGVHVYFSLARPLSPAEWQPLADALKGASRAYELHADPTCTSDSARLLRPIGALHSNGNRVAVLRKAAATYTLDELSAKLKLQPADPQSSNQPDGLPSWLQGVPVAPLTAYAAHRELTGETIAAMLACLDVMKFRSYEPWRNLMFAVKAANPGALGAFIAWSAQDVEKFDEASLRSIWAQARTDREGGIGAGTLVKLARDAGWREAAAPGEAQPAGAPAAAVTAAPASVKNGATGSADGTATAQVRAAAAAVEFAFDQFGECRLKMRVGSRVEWVRVESATARDALVFAIISAGGKAPGRDVLDRLISEMRAGARHAGRRVTIHVRVAPYGDGYALDLGDGRMVAIDATGWRVVSAEPIAFARDGGVLPEPQWKRSTRDALDRLREWLLFLGVQPAALNITIVVLANMLRSGVTYPILELVGSGGSGKSSAAWALGSLIDPSASGELPDGAIEVEALAALAQTRRVLFVDNASAVTREQSDLLCKVSTGTEVARRKLYTDADAVRLPLHRSVLLTAVSPVLGRGDAVDRTVRLTFAPRENYLTKDEFRAGFRKQHAELLGALVALLSAALARIGEVKQQRRWNSRMVDVLQLGEALVQSADLPPGTFVSEWTCAREATARAVASGDRFIIALREALAVYARRAVEADELQSVRAVLRDGVAAARQSDGTHVIAVKPSSLLAQLAPAGSRDFRGEDWLPKTERALADALARVQPLLRDTGVIVERRGVEQNKAHWVFTVSPTSGDSGDDSL